MNYITYEVKVYVSGSKYWYLNGKLHREDGPAIEYADGSKFWYLDGKRYSEADWKKAVNPDSCDGKTVEIDGKKYRLTEIQGDKNGYFNFAEDTFIKRSKKLKRQIIYIVMELFYLTIIE